MTEPPERRRELLPGVCFVVSMGCAVGLAVVYAAGGQPQAEGALLFGALGGIGLGLVLWAKRFMPTDHVVEERGRIASSEEEVRSFTADFDAGSSTFERRRFLSRLLVGALAALGAAALFPIRSLGPRPGRGLKTTPWRQGIRVVTEEGDPVRAAAVDPDNVLTVFPEGHVGDETAQTVLIRLGDRIEPRPGREDWSPEGLIAYSKVCTHAGCPVGLFEQESGRLLCPCHQSTFDATDGARPTFGPATRSLPQLPLAVDDDGFLVAQDDFPEPVGPGFWDRDT